jgi:hypothetical protein
VTDLVDELKKYKPTSLRVELEDGTLRTVPMPKAGARWAKAVRVLDALPWVKVECLDGKGGILGVVEAEEEDDPAERLGDGGAAALGKVLVAVMQSTMGEFRKTFESQLKGMAEIQRAMTDGMAAVTESYQTALRVQAASLAGAAAGESGHDEVVKMMQLAAMMLHKQPAVAAAPAGGGHG